MIIIQKFLDKVQLSNYKFVIFIIVQNRLLKKAKQFLRQYAPFKM